ncbi:MAG: Flp family type IVb pilin [Hyphomonas sp.]
MRLVRFLNRFARDTRGATAVEYGLICALIVIGILGGVTAFANANDDNYQLIEQNLIV